VRVDLNADIGEAASPEEEAVELALVQYVTSVNIACGAHAGDPLTARRALARARTSGVYPGAHPGYPDREGRGRRDQHLPAAQVTALVADQVASLVLLAAELGLALTHVKPHGSLYNQAVRDPDLAAAIAAGVRKVDVRLRLVGLAGSRLLEAGRDAGLVVLGEAFVDRAYRPDGSLVPRTERGALISRPADAVAQALTIVCDRRVKTADGSWQSIDADTLCLHGDTPGAVDLARVVRGALQSAGVDVRGPQ
jgi:UPF0271 protein